MEIQVGSETLYSRPRRVSFVRALGGQEWKRSVGWKWDVDETSSVDGGAGDFVSWD